MKTVIMIGALIGLLAGCGKDKQAPDTITEQVEQITYRIQLRHVGCAKDGYWERCGAAERIEGDGVFKDVYLYPHKCTGCGATQTLFNVSYPQFRREWRAVK